jgi:hypothetical protein
VQAGFPQECILRTLNGVESRARAQIDGTDHGVASMPSGRGFSDTLLSFRLNLSDAGRLRAIQETVGLKDRPIES